MKVFKASRPAITKKFSSTPITRTATPHIARVPKTTAKFAHTSNKISPPQVLRAATTHVVVRVKVPKGMNFFHTSRIVSKEQFDLKDLPGMKLQDLRKVAEQNGIDVRGMDKNEIIEELTPLAKGSKVTAAKGITKLSAHWDKVTRELKTKPLPPAEGLSFASLDEAQNESDALAIFKSIMHDFKVQDSEIVATMRLLERLDNEPELLQEHETDEEYLKARLQLLNDIKTGLEKLKDWNLDQEICRYFDHPYSEEEEGPAWMKSYLMELLFTTLLDHRPEIEMSGDAWDENSLLMKINEVLDANKLGVKLAYDPSYNWENASGDQPLTVHLETTNGQQIMSTTYNFPDPNQFDQQDLMVPINELLSTKKNVKLYDATDARYEDEIAYTWIMMPKDDGDRLVQKYGAFTEWYEEFPLRNMDEEEGFEEEEEGDFEEAAPVKKLADPKVPPKPKK